MATLFCRADIAAQYHITMFQLINIGDPLNDLAEVISLHHAASLSAVLGIIRKLHGV